MNEHDEVQQNNMISNLPLLFANGYPTSLDKISEAQLEKFIPFMVQCSLGHINVQCNLEFSEPEWWPEDIPYNVPFIKPKRFSGNWMDKMKEVVIICYQFHKSIFLLRFCSDLASYEHASLRFMNNYNSTTSLFDRRSNKLLVTFRNENMSYDQPSRTRKCLLQNKSKSGNWRLEYSQQQAMVEPAPFDIYLCDYCDAELYSKEAIQEHEKTCNSDDVILCCDSSNESEEGTSTSTLQEDDELRKRFLLNFNLQSSKECENAAEKRKSIASNLQKEGFSPQVLKKALNLPKRNRTAHSLARCPTIPISSPAGMNLVRSTNTLVGADYLVERLERVERFCSISILSKNQLRPRFLEKKSVPEPHCTFKQPADYNLRLYSFPRKHYTKRKLKHYELLNSMLMKRCRPVSIQIKKLNMKKSSNSSCAINIKLARDLTQNSNWKILESKNSSEEPPETIDLCSSEDEEGEGVNGNTANTQEEPGIQSAMQKSSQQNMPSHRKLQQLSETKNIAFKQVKHVSPSPATRNTNTKQILNKNAIDNSKEQNITTHITKVPSQQQSDFKSGPQTNCSKTTTTTTTNVRLNSHDKQSFNNVSVQNSKKNKDSTILIESSTPAISPSIDFPANKQNLVTNLSNDASIISQPPGLYPIGLNIVKSAKRPLESSHLQVKNKLNLQKANIIPSIPPLKKPIPKTTILSSFSENGAVFRSNSKQDLSEKVPTSQDYTSNTEPPPPKVRKTIGRTRSSVSDGIKNNYVHKKRGVSENNVAIVKNLDPSGIVSIDLTS